MKNILVLGASGMAGHMIYTVLNETTEYAILGTTNSQNFVSENKKLNIYDRDLLIKIIEDFKPDFVINCVGILIKESKDFPDHAIFSNAYLPHLLSRLSTEKDFKLIHISTDCVFSGKKGGYKEDSIKDATDTYGLSKSLGEINDHKNLTIRTSIIGPEIKNNGEGLFHWFMTQGQNEVTGYKSNMWSGVTTLELAKFIKWVLEKDYTGLIHLTNGIPISKFDLLNMFNDVYEKGVIINDNKDYACDKSFINTIMEYPVPTYEEMIREQKEFMDSHDDFYSHYKA